MRQPTPDSVLYAWWNAALRGERPPVHDGEPHCGFYRRKLVKGGPWVPAMIYVEADTDGDTGELTSDERFACLLNGKPANAHVQWSWLCGNPITLAEYRGLQHQHNAMRDETQPSRSLDLLRVAPPAF